MRAAKFDFPELVGTRKLFNHETGATSERILLEVLQHYFEILSISFIEFKELSSSLRVKGYAVSHV